MIEPLYPGQRSRILHEYPSVTRITPCVLGNAVAGTTAVRFYLPSVQEYVVFREFECILKAIYSPNTLCRENPSRFTYVYYILCSSWRSSFEVCRR